MYALDRREFLKLAGAALLWRALPPMRTRLDLPIAPELPASLGRIASAGRQAVRSQATSTAKLVAWKKADEIIPLFAAIVGQAPWPSNPIWYQTDEGFIHSGYVQPVENRPAETLISVIESPGVWAQVCVPVALAQYHPTHSRVVARLYYGTVYRLITVVVDQSGGWWYQLKDGLNQWPRPYVPAHTVRLILPEELAPLSPSRSDKRIEVSIAQQTLTCFEGETAVFNVPIASGLHAYPTPRGQHRVLFKRHTDHMIGGAGIDYYNLPGVAFPTYFTWSGVAIHGTFWHNDFGRRRSHGCINVTNEAARWLFRWTEPVVPYETYNLFAGRGQGTPIIVV